MLREGSMSAEDRRYIRRLGCMAGRKILLLGLGSCSRMDNSAKCIYRSLCRPDLQLIVFEVLCCC